MTEIENDYVARLLATYTTERHSEDFIYNAVYSRLSFKMSWHKCVK